jgi:CxxC-x17-CxxC domain-containing protein
VIGKRNKMGYNDFKNNNRGGNFRNNNFRDNDNGPREEHKAKCDKCGKDCILPFKPTQGKPVYCRDCFREMKPRDDRRDGGRGNFGGNRGGNFGGNRRDNFRSNDRPREEHKATCDECKKECTLPFKPTEGKPVYCRDCFQTKRRD